MLETLIAAAKTFDRARMTANGHGNYRGSDDFCDQAESAGVQKDSGQEKVDYDQEEEEEEEDFFSGEESGDSDNDEVPKVDSKDEEPKSDLEGRTKLSKGHKQFWKNGEFGLYNNHCTCNKYVLSMQCSENYC